MFDKSPESLANLSLLKRKDKSAGRSKQRSLQIRRFIKDQLTSGKTFVYAYRDPTASAWVRTTLEESEEFKRSISPVSSSPHVGSHEAGPQLKRPFKLHLS